MVGTMHTPGLVLSHLSSLSTLAACLLGSTYLSFCEQSERILTPMRQSEIKAIAEPLLSKGATITKVDYLAKLWKGYGHIARIHLDTSKCGKECPNDTFIVKIVRTSKDKAGQYDEDHARKVLSYQVEANLYMGFEVNNKVDQCFMPACLAVQSQTVQDVVEVVLILQDLSVLFPVMTENRDTLNDAQVTKSLEWLANFHGTTWEAEDARTDYCPTPREAAETNWNKKGLWKQGGYHYLATRMKELNSISPTGRWGKLGLHAGSDLPFAVDWCLNNPSDRRRLSLIHGDVKAANMAFDDEDAGRIVVYDYQYVGLGLGVQDLAKFLTTSIPADYLDRPDGEQKLLKQYHRFLLHKAPTTIEYGFDELVMDWELALVNWVRFLAGWTGGFWGNVDWLQNRVEALLRDQKWVDDVVKRYKEGTQETPT